jgi:hypothetical protein
MGQLSFNQYRDRYMMEFYHKTKGKKFIYEGVEIAKYQVFATIFARYRAGNSEVEIILVRDGKDNNFLLVIKEAACK